MSWDVTVQRFSREYSAIEDIPEDEQCLPLGSRAEVHAAISQYFPSTDWADPAWGNFESSDGSIEFSLGKEEPNSGFMMHIRASSAVVRAIVAMCRAAAWQALDCSNGVLLEKAGDPTAGLEQWSAYHNQVIGNA
jgi:hypothetical protein